MKKKKERKKEVEIFTTGYQGWSLSHFLTLPIEAFFKKRNQRQVLWGICEIQITNTTYAMWGQLDKRGDC